MFYAMPYCMLTLLLCLGHYYLATAWFLCVFDAYYTLRATTPYFGPVTVPSTLREAVPCPTSLWFDYNSVLFGSLSAFDPA